MEFIILGLLLFKQLTIYEINLSFKRGLSLIYASSYGSIQHAVRKLLREGYITFHEIVENGRNKKIYTVNDKGRQYFFEWMESEISVAKLETAMLTKVYFLGLIEDDDRKLSIIEDIIAKTDQVEAELNHLNDELSAVDIPREIRHIANFQIKTLDYGIMAHAAGKRWLHDLMNEIKAEKK